VEGGEEKDRERGKGRGGEEKGRERDSRPPKCGILATPLVKPLMECGGS